MITIQVTQKTVCNTVRYYPSCDKSILFSKLVGRKTFHKSELDIIRKLGIKVEVHKED